MKTLGDYFDTAGLEEWLVQDKWPGSLAVGTTCGCDVSRLGEDICAHLNFAQKPGSGFLMAFDREDIRRLAGDPSMRRRILSADPEVNAGPGCDYERMIRSVASLGGAVLAGQCCLDATRGLDKVFRVMVSRGGHCRGDDPSMRLDPVRFSPESLVRVIADSFADWCRDRLPDPAERRRMVKDIPSPRAVLAAVGA